MNDLKIHHICIQTNNYEESKAFYTNILGFKIIKETANFHGRDYNTWLEMNGFMIELQTGKEELSQFNTNTEAIAHFCMKTSNIEKTLESILSTGYKNFKTKNGDIMYWVEDGKLFKIIAPEGTIIEIRDKTEI